MSHIRTFKRLAVLTEGGLDIYRNKTAMTLLRFRPEDVVAVIDSKHVGCDLHELTGMGRGIPIVASIEEAVPMGIEWLVIGVATPGGYLPRMLRPQVYEAIRNRIGVISGLHESVDGDPNLVALAARHCVELVNLRKIPDMEHTISTGKARQVEALRVLTVGTDTNIGKTTTSLSLERWLRKNGHDSRFVATGQDGIMVAGRGLCIDRVISDFTGGAVERLVLHEAKTGIMVIEGQNSILSPCYSGSALSLLHGSCPDAMILCHAPTRTHLRHTDVPVPSLARYIELYESLLAPIHPTGKVVAIALNTLGLDDAEAKAAIRAAREETGLPAADPVRGGDEACRILAQPLIALRARRGRRPARRKAAKPRRAARAGRSARAASR